MKKSLKIVLSTMVMFMSLAVSSTVVYGMNYDNGKIALEPALLGSLSQNDEIAQGRPNLGTETDWWSHISHLLARRLIENGISDLMEGKTLGYRKGDTFTIDLNDFTNDLNQNGIKNRFPSMANGFWEIKNSSEEWFIIDAVDTINNPEKNNWKKKMWRSAFNYTGVFNILYMIPEGNTTFYADGDSNVEIKLQPNGQGFYEIVLTRLETDFKKINPINSVALKNVLYGTNTHTQDRTYIPSLGIAFWEGRSGDNHTGKFSPRMKINSTSAPDLSAKQGKNGMDVPKVVYGSTVGESYIDFKKYLEIEGINNDSQIDIEAVTPDQSFDVAGKASIPLEIKETLDGVSRSIDFDFEVEVERDQGYIEVYFEEGMEYGHKLLPMKKIFGYVGDPYDVTEEKETKIDGYTLITDPKNMTGVFKRWGQTIHFLYKKNESMRIEVPKEIILSSRDLIVDAPSAPTIMPDRQRISDDLLATILTDKGIKGYYSSGEKETEISGEELKLEYVGLADVPYSPTRAGSIDVKVTGRYNNLVSETETIKVSITDGNVEITTPKDLLFKSKLSSKPNAQTELSNLSKLVVNDERYAEDGWMITASATEFVVADSVKSTVSASDMDIVARLKDDSSEQSLTQSGGVSFNNQSKKDGNFDLDDKESRVSLYLATRNSQSWAKLDGNYRTTVNWDLSTTLETQEANFMAPQLKKEVD